MVFHQAVFSVTDQETYKGGADGGETSVFP